MIDLGRWNELEITRFTDHGAYLDAGDVGEILMPKAYVERQMKPGDRVNVFVYLDGEERLVGTTETPLACVGEFAFLEVSWTNKYGAFLDWGLMKDLFVPFREQKKDMEIGDCHIVYIYIDEETHRIAASAKVEKWLIPASTHDYYRGKEVNLLVQQRTPLGFKVIVDNAHSGLIYDDQIYESIRTGDRMKGYIVDVRPDGKLDVSIQRIGKGRFRDFAETLYEELQQAGGTLPYSDRSSSEEIARRFGVSKKTFKRAVGTLYREKKIRLSENDITLIHL